MSALSSCVMKKGITSEAIVMVNSISQTDGRQSHVTVQIYLGDAHVEGGATRTSKGRRGDKDAFVDIELKMGRVLIFQQRRRGLSHSGEDVTKGVKYAPLHVQTFRGFVGWIVRAGFYWTVCKLLPLIFFFSPA